MRKITQIIIHCSATRPSWMHNNTLAEQLAEIRDWHVEERHFSDIGYHDLIGRAGDTLPGRPLTRPGAHCIGHNAHSVGVCLIGGHGSAATDAPADHYTAAQLDALGEYIDRWRARVPGITIHGHNEFAPKACPGFDVAQWLDQRTAAPDPAPACPGGIADALADRLAFLSRPARRR